MRIPIKTRAIVPDDMLELDIILRYDAVGRIVFSQWPLYLCEKDGKKGVINKHGIEVISCVQDEIYEMYESDGIMPFIKDGKWGLYHCGETTETIFDDIDIITEDYCKVLLNGTWGWVDADGRFTLDKESAWFGSWYDYDK